jgi:hypothetical protein
VSKRLPVVIAHDEAGFLFFDGPRRWEAAGRHGGSMAASLLKSNVSSTLV